MARPETWRPEDVRSFPPAYRRAVREMLLAAKGDAFECRAAAAASASGPSGSSGAGPSTAPAPVAREGSSSNGGVGLHSLPMTHMEDLFARMSMPVTPWKAVAKAADVAPLRVEKK